MLLADRAWAASGRLFPFLVLDVAAMGSSRAEEKKVESTGINASGVDDIGEAGRQGAETSLAGEKRGDPGGVAAPTRIDVQQHGAGKLPENERVAKALQVSVSDAFEKDLKKQDERARQLAKAYRDSQGKRKEREERAKAQLKEREELEKAQRKERGKAGRKRNGITTSNPLESASNSVESVRINDDNSCYIEIEKLVLIEKSVIHKKALEEWDRKEKLFTSRVERKSTKVESRKNEVYNLIGFFSVFQGVVLTAVSQSNLLHCNNRWSPILLSVLASIVTIAGVYQKLKQIASLEKTIFSENQALKDVVRRGQALRREGKDFVFAQFPDGKNKATKKGYSTWWFGCINYPLNQRSLRAAAMSRITLKNDLVGKEVKITEGNAGSTRELCTLKPGDKFNIHNDKNATYREYFFITLPDNRPLRVLTSDDFAEYKGISIYEEGGTIDWMGTEERPNPAQGGPFKRFFHRLGFV